METTLKAMANAGEGGVPPDAAQDLPACGCTGQSEQSQNDARALLPDTIGTADDDTLDPSIGNTSCAQHASRTLGIKR
jgi:hypothetical protein